MVLSYLLPIAALLCCKVNDATTFMTATWNSTATWGHPEQLALDSS